LWWLPLHSLSRASGPVAALSVPGLSTLAAVHCPNLVVVGFWGSLVRAEGVLRQPVLRPACLLTGTALVRSPVARPVSSAHATFHPVFAWGVVGLRAAHASLSLWRDPRPLARVVFVICSGSLRYLYVVCGSFQRATFPCPQKFSAPLSHCLFALRFFRLYPFALPMSWGAMTPSVLASVLGVCALAGLPAVPLNFPVVTHFRAGDMASRWGGGVGMVCSQPGAAIRYKAPNARGLS